MSSQVATFGGVVTSAEPEAGRCRIEQVAIGLSHLTGSTARERRETQRLLEPLVTLCGQLAAEPTIEAVQTRHAHAAGQRPEGSGRAGVGLDDLTLRLVVEAARRSLEALRAGYSQSGPAAVSLGKALIELALRHRYGQPANSNGEVSGQGWR